MGSEININIEGITQGIGKTKDFLTQKKVLNIIIIALFLFLLIGSASMRLQNLPLLKDQTTGEYIPLALDPFYFLRLAETINEQGGLPDIDVMRYPSEQVEFSNEILPYAVVSLYKIISAFDQDATLRYVDVISPVIFFVLGLVVFFILIYLLTKSKLTALISSMLLAIIPPYLHRTLAGFADHESIGMFAFFLVLLVYILALKFLDKEKKVKNPMIKTILFGLLVGFFSAFTIASWWGVAFFVFMIIPLSFGLFWIFRSKKAEHRERLPRLLTFYVTWFLSSILFGLLYGFGANSIISKVFLGNSSIINAVVLLFILVDFSMIKLKNKISFLQKEKIKKYRILWSLLISVIIGAVFLSVTGKNIFLLIQNIFGQLIHPFGTGRVGLTVAENRQPFLNDWIAQIGKKFFWFFYLGLAFIGIEISKGIKRNKNKFLFSLFWIIMITGVLFSRISSNSLFNGTNTISSFVYFGSLALFGLYATWLYFNDVIEIKPEMLLISSWLFFMLIAGRGAIRLFFMITPSACFMIGYFSTRLFNYTKKSKDDLLKMLFLIASILVIFFLITGSLNFYESTKQQAQFSGPSAHIQWQKAMSWVRTNTPQESIFVHWWDYGHWVTYLGERRVVTDGGHAVDFWDHLIGRYLLTTPNPETALSFMKTHEVSYLLIDPTDIGKYPAYSGIGNNLDDSDRLSFIPTMISSQEQIQETQNGTLRVYQGGPTLDEDIVYNLDGNEIFLPANNAGLGAVLLEIVLEETQIRFNQPQGVFVYNQNQITLPIRYLYFKGQFIDFENGVESTLYVIPRVIQTGQGIQIDEFGAAFYMSPRISRGLVGQLYLLNDPFDNYETLKLAHAEPDPTINSLNAQGANLNEFTFFDGIRGPIKIWKVDYPENIVAKEEFLRTKGVYGEFDDLEFTK